MKLLFGLLPLVTAMVLAGPASAQYASQDGEQVCTAVTPEVVRCDQQSSPFQQQYSEPQPNQQPSQQQFTPQPWQQAIPQGFGPTTNCTSDGMGVVRCN